MKLEYEKPTTQVFCVITTKSILQESLGEWEDPNAGTWIP